MTKRIVVLTAISSAALLAGAAPILGQMNHPGGGGAASGATAVTINDAGYSPGETVVAPGQSVTWTNAGSNPHTVTSDVPGIFDSGTMGAKAKFVLTAPAAVGTYTYNCTFHAYMRGSLVVSTVTLMGPKKVLAGKTASVHGAAPGTPAGTPVAIEALGAGGAWTAVATSTVAADGTYHVVTRPLTGGATLRARIGEGLSPALVIPVAPKVVIKRSGKRGIAVTVKPAKAAKGNLERLNTDTFRWVKAKKVTINRRGKATVTVPKKAGKYRVTLLPAKGLAAASSAGLSFR